MYHVIFEGLGWILVRTVTVLPANSDSEVMFYLRSYKELESIDHLYIDPIRRIGLIHK